MKTKSRLHSLFSAATLVAISVSSFAQPAQPVPAAGAAPAPRAGAGRGGGGRGGGAPALSSAQQAATGAYNVPTELTTAASDALTALTRAAFSVPTNPDSIQSASQKLAEAELALSLARATEFQKVQDSLEKLTPAQAIANLGNIRGGGANWQTAYNDHAGFTQLFDGKTLNGWDGEEGKWNVEDGAIHRHQTVEPRNFVDFGQYHIHFNEVFGDFDLKVEFKVRGGNAGIQYRSRLETALRAQDGEPARAAAGGGRGGGGGATIPLRNVAAAIADPLGKPLPANIRTLDDALKAGLLPEGPPYGNGTGHPWQVSGYQFDITGAGTGNWYEGQGRGTVGSVGDILLLGPNNARNIIGKVAENPWALWGKPNDWNSVEIVARGNTIIHMLNGHVVLVGIDDDPERRALKGIISLQLESPSDCEVWYRNVWLKKL